MRDGVSAITPLSPSARSSTGGARRTYTGPFPPLPSGKAPQGEKGVADNFARWVSYA